MREKYQRFEHFNPSCKHFSVAKDFLSNGTSKGFYYALTLLNILNTKLWTKLSSLRRAKLTRGTFYSLHQVFSFQARYLLSNLNGWCRSYLRTTTKSLVDYWIIICKDVPGFVCLSCCMTAWSILGSRRSNWRIWWNCGWSRRNVRERFPPPPPGAAGASAEGCPIRENRLH